MLISRTSAASQLAQDLLRSELPDRLAHVAGVAERAAEVCRILGLQDEDIVAAAWLHDVGYAPAIATTGFHPLDGARFAKRAGYSTQISSLVAFHSSADIEADETGWLHELVAEFPRPEAEDLEILTFCDLTVGPQGQPLTVDERLAEILERYEPDDAVHRSTRRAKHALRQVVARVERRVADQSQ